MGEALPTCMHQASQRSPGPTALGPSLSRKTRPAATWLRLAPRPQRSEGVEALSQRKKIPPTSHTTEVRSGPKDHCHPALRRARDAENREETTLPCKSEPLQRPRPSRLEGAERGLMQTQEAGLLGPGWKPHVQPALVNTNAGLLLT